MAGGWGVRKPVALMAVAALLSITSPALAQAAPRPIGDTRVFATIPYPGHPGGLAVSGQTLYVDTAAPGSDRPFDGQDEIFSYDLRTGGQTNQKPNPIDVSRVAPVPQNMGLAGLVLDAAGRLYAADMNGRVVRMNPRTGAQDTYATIPTSTYTAYTSSDGSTWTAVAGSSVTISMSSTVLAGLAVTSHNSGALSTAPFDTVGVSASTAASPTPTNTPLPATATSTSTPAAYCPSPWSCADIGSPAPAGSQSLSCDVGLPVDGVFT